MSSDIDIRDHGAVPDGETLCTAAIQAAIDACHAAGGGRVVCGPGRWLTGSLELRSHVELHLTTACTLVGSTCVDDYDDFVAPGLRSERAPEGNSKSLIRAAHAEHIAVTGPGTIDGSGLAFYDTTTLNGRFFGKPPTPRPRLLMLYRCHDVLLTDSLWLDSPCWTMWLMQCQQVGIRGVRIIGDQRMINNDGIDLDSCQEVTVSDCRIRTGDDCLILRAIDKMFDEPMPCERITITNCVLDSWCQGIRIGCPADGTIRDATFSNLTITSTNRGVIFEFPHRYLREGTGNAAVHDMVFSNLTVDVVGLPLHIVVEEGIALPRLSDLSFENCRFRSGGPVTIMGSPETIIRDVRLSNVTVTARHDEAAVTRLTGGIELRDALVCRYCDGLELTGVRLNQLAKATA